jgi:hypothetical protein
MDEDEDDLYGENGTVPTEQPVHNDRPMDDAEDSDEEEEMDEDDSDSDVEIVTERPGGDDAPVLVFPKSG